VSPQNDGGIVTNDLLSTIRPRFNQCSSEFKYNYRLSEPAKGHWRFTPAAIPVLWSYILERQYILTHTQACLLGTWSVKCDGGVNPFAVIAGRLQNFVASVMREIDVCYKLKEILPTIEIQKSYSKDLSVGREDLSCLHKGIRLAFKIQHEGDGSILHDVRKSRKQGSGLVTLTAPMDSSRGIHYVPKAEIEERLSQRGIA
jgi:hypothetical protein